jgi:hypothetical protein
MSLIFSPDLGAQPYCTLQPAGLRHPTSYIPDAGEVFYWLYLFKPSSLTAELGGAL